MFDCNQALKRFHSQEVTLPESEQINMRKRRDANRVRLKNGLTNNGKPLPYQFVSQGSYRMKTMLQDPNNDYDIDDGAYFHSDDLKGPRDGEMDSLQVRHMVCDAMKDERFNFQPEVRSNCVRIQYESGYHVDIPIYRKFGTDQNVYFEHASENGWKVSDARHVTEWYEEKRKETSDPHQFLRINRYLKKFAKSRPSWKNSNLSGFGITVLLSEVIKLVPDRDDVALHYTMKAMYHRLQNNTVIYHPVTTNEVITNNRPDPKATFFKCRIEEALVNLIPISNPNCDENTALKCWDKVFGSKFFQDCKINEKKPYSSIAVTGASSSSVISETANARQSINRSGSDRNA